MKTSYNIERLMNKHLRAMLLAPGTGKQTRAEAAFEALSVDEKDYLIHHLVNKVWVLAQMVPWSRSPRSTALQRARPDIAALNGEDRNAMREVSNEA